MSDDDVVRGEAGEFFDRHIRSKHSLDDIKALDAVLPDNPAVLRRLASRCLDDARKSMRAGHHMEGRRLDVLGWQLQKRAEEADQQKRS